MMKRAVSISLGSSKRDKTVEITLRGETVRLERRGTDGDMEKAAQWFRDLDGQVDAFGVGGADLGMRVAGRWYPFHGVRPMVRYIRQTPVVDGTGLKNTLEARVAAQLERRLAGETWPRRVMFTVGGDRWGMTQSFLRAGYAPVFCDLMFALDIPIAVRSEAWAKRLYRVIAPVATRLPFDWLYPTGEKQERWQPKYTDWYAWAGVIAGDCHYIKRHMPAQLAGKIVCTNSTTPEDVERFRAAGVRWLVTTTPIIDGRSFGTNLMEAALVAVSGRRRPLTDAELETSLDELQLEPTVQRLN